MSAKRIVASAVTALLWSVPSVTTAGTLLSFDFNGKTPWPDASSDVLPATPVPVEPTVEAKDVGTVDAAGSITRTGGLLMSAQVGAIKEKWEAVFTSGLIAVKTDETDLGKFTLAFNLSATAARPVTVRVSSFDAAKKKTGTLEGFVLPAAPNYDQRMVLDLSALKAADGKFNPTDPFVQFVFSISGPVWPGDTTHELRLDNLHYATPAFYVSPKGSDDNDGRSEAKPLLDPQAAVDRAKPGDIVVLMDGEYRRGKKNTVQDGIVAFRHTGSPAAWITLKNYPGQTPLLRSDAWNTVQVRKSKEDGVQADPVLAYLEVRGLHIMGFVEENKRDHPADIGEAKPGTNGNGISADGRGMDSPPHHLRFADNLIEKCGGAGIGAGQCDWVQVENNVCRDNCWTTIYATSGISLLGWHNFDAQDNVHKWLIRNNLTYNNRTYVAWKQIGKISDGNGIIIDTNVAKTEGGAFIGRTLIQNNVSYNNGGSGIHAFRCQRIDIVNNTAFGNGASPELAWGQIFLQRTDDARVLNNVLYARPGQPVNTVSKDISDKGNTNVVRANNVYFGGAIKPIMGTNDVVADPKFVKTGYGPDADYKVHPGSPALGHGQWDPLVPLFDLQGRPRPLDGKPDAGAYQH